MANTLLKIIFYDSLLGKWLYTIFTSDGDIIGSEVPHFLLAIYSNGDFNGSTISISDGDFDCSTIFTSHGNINGFKIFTSDGVVMVQRFHNIY